MNEPKSAAKRRNLLAFSLRSMLHWTLWVAIFLGGWMAHQWKVDAEREAAAKAQKAVTFENLQQLIQADPTQVRIWEDTSSGSVEVTGASSQIQWNVEDPSAVEAE